MDFLLFLAGDGERSLSSSMDKYSAKYSRAFELA
jgi:hypothetical protein